MFLAVEVLEKRNQSLSVLELMIATMLVLTAIVLALLEVLFDSYVSVQVGVEAVVVKVEVVNGPLPAEQFART